MFLNFEFPPLLYYIRSGPGIFEPGRVHMHTKNPDLFDLLVVFEGKMHLWEGGQVHTISKGEFLILEPHKEHYGFKPHTERTFYHYVQFQATGSFFQTPDEQHFLEVSDFKNFLSIPKKGKLQNTHIILDQLKELKSLHTFSNKMYKHQQQTIFQQLLPQLTRQNNTSVSPQIEELVVAVALHMEKNFRNRISYSTLSDKFNFTSTYLTRCFKKIYGLTPLDYLNKIRFAEAKINLKNTDLSIEKIAFDVGFNSTSYFSRAFAKEFGMSPLKYRKFYQEFE